MSPNITRRNQALGAAVLMGLMLGIGCGASGSSDNPSDHNPNATDGGSSSIDDSGTSPPPPVDAACIPNGGADLPDDNFEDSNCDGIDGDRAQAIFVASSGSDTAPGTVEQPVKTIAKAVSLAAAAKKYVLVANGSYADAIVIDHVAVNIHGGYQPMGWQRINDRASVAPGTGAPLTIKNVDDAVVIDRLALKAPDAIDPGASSYAALVTSSKNVTLKHVALTAGRGADGLTPNTPSSSPQPASAGADGTSLAAATCNKSIPMAQRMAGCGAIANGGWLNGELGNGIGGVGGAGNNHEVYQPYGHDGAPGSPAGFGGAGAIGSGDGVPGIDGLRGAGGTPATNGFGSVTKDGYIANNGGTPGSTGSLGGSGGGGAGGFSACTPTNDCSLTNFYFVGGGGGQGGNGGIGGVGASGAGGGGASIGLFIFASTVTITSSEITTAEGGRGGNAILGADGQPGGAAGRGGSGTSPAGVGYNGGAGGRGGRGGAGGPGGGGPSIGLLVSGASPVKQGVTVNIGAGGKGGKGTPGVLDGADAVAVEIRVVGAGDAGPDAGP